MSYGTQKANGTSLKAKRNDKKEKKYYLYSNV